MASDRKNAIVTGASKGVGRGIAVELAGAGWNIGVNYNADEAGAAETVRMVENRGGSAWALQGDIGTSADVERVFTDFDRLAGRLNLLVNNAGVQTWASLFDLQEADFDRTIRTNLKGCFLCMKAAAPRMRDAGGGAIVNIGSGANRIPFPNLGDYCASKGGIDQLTRVAAVEFGPHQIRVNCVAPGAIEIERTRLEDPDYAGTWGAVTPIRRVGQVADVAAAVAYLASDEAAFVTGQTLYVDGGLWSQGVWPYERSEDG
ncbi:MAG: SDR family oxidoreductase [Pirellulaceae bacterium]|jgi:NAD(P)-dependent dehydrogenase (short-subunit alcohol dehydrogenase family)|nr:SDR family oxidoreductase [Pirellulaceae bacterium]MDP7019594.1 SDR family oxidoreductase [Pirellulaceae bacterium]